MFRRALVLVWSLCCWGALAVNENLTEPFSLRLVGGETRCRGKLQVRMPGQDWAEVRPAFIPHWFAHRACAELGCGSALSARGRQVSDRAAVYLYPLCEDCSLSDSFSSGKANQTLSLELHCSDALAVNDNSTEYALRLFGGQSECGGQLQVRGLWTGGRWTAVRPWGVGSLWFGRRVCAELGCGSALEAETTPGPITEAVFVRPRGSRNSSLIHAFDFSTRLADSTLQLHCSDSVRLVSGRSLCSGSVQIRDQSSDRSWTSVCEGALGRRGAEVLCRELGCGAPLLQGALSPLGQMFHCEGNESALMDCPQNQTRTDPGTCSGPALLLTCSEPVRLVGGPGRCEGALEARYRGEWRRVEAYNGWDLEAAGVVCGALGCGSAVSSEMERSFNRSALWEASAVCVKEQTLRDCVGNVAPGHYSLTIECSGLQGEPEETKPPEDDTDAAFNLI